MNWGIYAVGSAVFAALVAVLGKIGLQGVDSTLATTVRAVVMAVFLVIVSLAFGKFSTLDTFSNKTMVFIIFSGIAGALSWLCYFLAIKYGPVTGVVALDRTSVIFAFILAVIFLSESLTWQKAIGATLVTIGAILMAL